MTYSQWLDTLVSPITYFVQWLIQVAGNLIHNYFFITLLGIFLFLSFIWFLFYLFFDYIDKINDRYDDFNDKYYNYELFKEVQSDYLNKHYADEYDYRYRSKVLNSQVLNGYLQKNPDLDIDNKRLNNKNRIESLKEVEKELLNDDTDENDTDLSYISPKPQLASIKELHKNIIDENPDLHNELVKENNEAIDKILLDNGYIDYKGHLVNVNTGEVVKDFSEPVPLTPEEYSKLSKEQLKEIDEYNNKHFRFPKYNNNLIDDEDLESQLFS